MSALLTKETRIIVGGITGKAARLHTRIMKAYGTAVVGGVRPGAAGQTVEGAPVFDSMADAVAETGGDAAVLFVPAGRLRQAALETMEAGIKLVVMVPEHVLLHDTMAIVQRARELGARVIGPNTPGIIRPAVKAKMGFLPEAYFCEGPVGVASRSGTLTYEIVMRLTRAGVGQSTCIGCGGDPIVGTTFPQALQIFEDDPDTRAVVLIGEIGGSMEEEAAHLRAHGKVTKPVVCFLAGRNAPPEKRMGHAGAIIAAGRGTIASKLEALERGKIPVADLPSDVVPLVKAALRRR